MASFSVFIATLPTKKILYEKIPFELGSNSCLGSNGNLWSKVIKLSIYWQASIQQRWITKQKKRILNYSNISPSFVPLSSLISYIWVLSKITSQGFNDTKAYLLAMYSLALLCWNIFFPHFFFAKKLSVHNSACIKKSLLLKLQF